MPKPKGRQVQTAILVDQVTLDTVDHIAATECLSRADILRRVIRRGLSFEDGKVRDTAKQDKSRGAA